MNKIYVDYNIEITPIKKKYVCSNCGRKRVITYNRKCRAGGLLSTKGEQCLPFMLCPRCNKRTMVEENECIFNRQSY